MFVWFDTSTFGKANRVKTGGQAKISGFPTEKGKGPWS